MEVLIEISLFTIAISLVLSIITRLLVDPKKMKDVKLEMEFFKDKVNKAQKEGNTDDVKKYTSSMMSASKKQFGLSMKSLVVTMVVVIVALGYIHQTYDGFEADLAGNSTVTYKDTEISVSPVGDESISVDFGSGVKTYSYGELIDNSGAIFIPSKIDGKAKFSLIVAKTPFAIPIIGNYLNWFWFYVILSIPCSIFFRKVLGVEQ